MELTLRTFNPFLMCLLVSVNKILVLSGTRKRSRMEKEEKLKEPTFVIPSGRCRDVPARRINRYRDSFIPSVIRPLKAHFYQHGSSCEGLGPL